MKLALISDELVELNQQILNAYPGTHARPVQSAGRKLGHIRGDLDNKLFTEHDQIDPVELAKIYYPSTEQREAVRHGSDGTERADITQLAGSFYETDPGMAEGLSGAPGTAE